MEYVYSSTNSPLNSALISLFLVHSLSSVHLVLKTFFTFTMPTHHSQAHSKWNLGPYFDLRIHVVINFQTYHGHASQDIHASIDEQTDQLGHDLTQILEEAFLNMWGTYIPSSGNSKGRNNEYYKTLTIYWKMRELFGPIALIIKNHLGNLHQDNTHL